MKLNFDFLTISYLCQHIKNKIKDTKSLLTRLIAQHLHKIAGRETSEFTARGIDKHYYTAVRGIMIERGMLEEGRK